MIKENPTSTSWQGNNCYANNYITNDAKTSDIAAIAQCLNLTLNQRRTEYVGQCPLCHYGKPTFTLKNTPHQLLVYCHACQSKDALFDLVRRLANRDNSANSFRGDVSAMPEKPYCLDKRSDDDQAKRAKALSIYKQGQPINDTLGEVYLRWRGLGGRPDEDCIPKVVRFIPSLKHPNGTYHPAIVAPINDWAGRSMGVHRTYLAHDGKGKAPVSNPKLTLGRYAGGAIQLLPADEGVILAEGIETAWAAMAMLGEPPWACVGTGGMIRVELPPLPMAQTVFIVADHDANGAGMKAAREAETRFLLEGRDVRIFHAREIGLDAADLLQKGGFKW